MLDALHLEPDLHWMPLLRHPPIMTVGAPTSGAVTQWLDALGGCDDPRAEFYGAIESLSEDPGGHAAVIIWCDAFRGIETVRRDWTGVASITRLPPAIFVSSSVAEQEFPTTGPILLRDPLSRLSLRMAIEHALWLPQDQAAVSVYPSFPAAASIAPPAAIQSLNAPRL